MFAILVLAAMPQDMPIEQELAQYRRVTSAVIRCEPEHSDEIVVCAARTADRYRLPLVIPTPGDPRNEGALAERARLLRQPNACETKIGATPYGCGHFGVTAGTGGGRGLRIVERERAP